jgi:parallel beta-helix repeat protein
MPPPSISNTLLAQYDASTLGLADGAAVATWPDDSASNFDLTQATSGSRPEMDTGVSPSGLDGVLFNSGRHINRVSGSTVFPATKTIFFAAKNPPNNTNHTRFSITDDDGAGRGLVMMYHSGLGQWVFGGSLAGGEFLNWTNDSILNTNCLWTFVVKPTSAFVRTNGTQVASGNIANLIANSDIFIGNLSNTLTPSFTMYEWLVYDGEVSSGDITTIEDYLNDKWIAVISDGAGTGAITWAGTASGTSVHSGSATGAISWAGTATGVAPGISEGSATGAISWAGSATGVAPSAGVGSATGSISWAGTATGFGPTPPAQPAVSAPWVEVWSRPGDVNYAKRIADLPILDTSVTVPYSGVGKGSMQLPRNYSRLDEILKVVTDAPEESVWSTIKIVDDTGWLYEWLPGPRLPTGGKNDTSIEFAGDGLESIWGFARVEPWDWDGSDNFVSTFPDWIWGGANQLTNGDFETSAPSPIVYQLAVIPTLDSNGDPLTPSGSYTLSDGTDTTIAIDWDENNPVIIEALLEQFAAIDDVLVTGTGIEDDYFTIEFVVPFEGITLTAADSVTNGTIDIFKSTFGSLQPSGWTKSSVVSRGTPRIFGSYTNFRVVGTQPHTGTKSLLVDAAPVTSEYTRYAGAQQVVSVKAGGLYQASVWVYPTSGTDTFRFIIRGIDGDFIQAYPGGLTSTTLVPNTWNQLIMSDVNVGTNTSIIFRVAVTNNVGVDPSPFYIDDAEFTEGMVATTVGCMLVDLYEDAVLDHAPGRLVWENLSGDPGDVYLTLDFNCDEDSAGAEWDRIDVSQTFQPRMSYLQVLDQIVEEGGYQWRVLPADWTLGTYILQVYNPGALGAIREAGVIGGSSDTGRTAKFFAPTSTAQLAEGANGFSSRVDNAGLVARFGRIEGSILDNNWTTFSSLVSAATNMSLELLTGAEDIVYTLAAPEQRPLSAYRPGDRIYVSDPEVFPLPGPGDDLRRVRRVSQIQLSLSKEDPEQFVVHISDAMPFRMVGGAGVKLTRGLVGQAATDSAVTALLKAYKPPRPIVLRAPPSLGGAGAPTIVLAPSNSSDVSKSKADFECPGTTDARTFQLAVDAAAGGRLLVTEGQVDLERPINVLGNTKIEGMGQLATILRYTGQTGQTILKAEADCVFTDFGITFASANEIGIEALQNTVVHRVAFFDAGFSAVGVFVTGDHVGVTDCWCECGWLVSATDEFEGVIVSDNRIPTGIIDCGSPTGWTVTGNRMENGAILAADGQRTVIALNEIADWASGSPFGFTGAAAHCLLLGNVVESLNGEDVSFGSGSTFSKLVGNIIRDPGRVNLVSALDCTIDSNTLIYPGEHGIRLSASKDCLIVGNKIYGPGQNSANTYDGVFLEGDSDRNQITANKIVSDPLGFVAARYAVNISAAACNDSIVVNNDFGVTADYGTGAYNNAGTGTRNTFPGGAVGDNFVT